MPQYIVSFTDEDGNGRAVGPFDNRDAARTWVRDMENTTAEDIVEDDFMRAEINELFPADTTGDQIADGWINPSGNLSQE